MRRTVFAFDCSFCCLCANRKKWKILLKIKIQRETSTTSKWYMYIPGCVCMYVCVRATACRVAYITLLLGACNCLTSHLTDDVCAYVCLCVCQRVYVYPQVIWCQICVRQLYDLCANRFHFGPNTRLQVNRA